MGAPAGNQFWKQRSKHGRDKLFQTPDLLWQACCEYFEYTDTRKWIKKDWVGKDAMEVERETETPYTYSGLCLYLNTNRGYFSDFKQTCSKDFSEIIMRVEDIMYTQKFEGASVGAFNQNIIARELGLADKIMTETFTVVINED
jgi:hypothetical protein